MYKLYSAWKHPQLNLNYDLTGPKFMTRLSISATWRSSPHYINPYLAIWDLLKSYQNLANYKIYKT